MSTPIAWLDDTRVGSWIAEGQLTEHGLVGSLVPPLFDSYVAVRLVGEDATAMNPDGDLRDHLVASLRAHAHGVECCTFALADLYGWDGNAAVEHDGQSASSASSSPPPMLETRLRSYLLYSGPIDAAGAVPRTGGPVEMPDLWWPDDRSWIVATDTDLDFVLVAGPRSLTGALARQGVYVEARTAHSWLT